MGQRDGWDRGVRAVHDKDEICQSDPVALYDNLKYCVDQLGPQHDNGRLESLPRV